MVLLGGLAFSHIGKTLLEKFISFFFEVMGGLMQSILCERMYHTCFVVLEVRQIQCVLQTGSQCLGKAEE